MAVDSQAQELLLRHRQVWNQKPVLRRIYREEFFTRLLSFRQRDGLCVEVGAGPGFFKQMFPTMISTDVVQCPWLDLVADAQKLPFRTSSVSNIFGLDVLHHLAAPIRFLREAERALVPGGRVILVEPWITPFSYLIYRYFHLEDCDLSAKPWNTHDNDSSLKKAFDGNQAVPYLLFGPKYRSRTLDFLPGLAAMTIEPFCLFAYLLSCGFKRTSFVPEFLYPLISQFEVGTLPLWRSIAALRVLIVLERVRDHECPQALMEG
jgi:SAM-dependent methyltransferase